MNHWETFNHRSLWQHSSWDAFQQSVGRETHHFSNAGAEALLIKYSLPFGLSWLEVPRGPLFKDEASLTSLMDEIVKFGKREQAIFIRMSSYQHLNLTDQKLKTAFKDHHPETSLVLDLSQSEEDLLTQMKPKGRYNIKLAEKHGIQIERCEEVDTFHHLLKKTGNRDGFGIHSLDYYQKMLQSLGKNAELLVAKYEDRVIAGGIFVYLDEWGIYYYGASDHHFRKYMAPYLIQWEAIKEAKKRGCKYYDFLGIAPENVANHAWAGVTSFKKKFGGNVVSYPQAKDLVLKPFWYMAYGLYKAKK